MKHSSLCEPEASAAPGSPGERAELFRDTFQWSWRESVRRGFGRDEAFDFVWDETIESVPLPAAWQRQLRADLLAWSRLA